MPPPELSTVVLGYRAGEALPVVAAPLHAVLKQSGFPFEIVLVANYEPGGNDITPDIADEFARRHHDVISVALPKEGGMGWDMRSGLRRASGRYLAVIDGDGQTSVEDVLRIYRCMKEQGADIAKGRRIQRHDGWRRRLISFVYNLAFQALFPTRGVRDVNGKPKGLTRNAYEALDLRSDDWFVDAEIVIGARRLGMTIAEVPVVFGANETRGSFVGLAAILEFVKNLIRQRVRGRS